MINPFDQDTRQPLLIDAIHLDEEGFYRLPDGTQHYEIVDTNGRVTDEAYVGDTSAETPVVSLRLPGFRQTDMIINNEGFRIKFIELEEQS